MGYWEHTTSDKIFCDPDEMARFYVSRLSRTELENEYFNHIRQQVRENLVEGEDLWIEDELFIWFDDDEDDEDEDIPSEPCPMCRYEPPMLIGMMGRPTFRCPNCNWQWKGSKSYNRKPNISRKSTTKPKVKKPTAKKTTVKSKAVKSKATAKKPPVKKKTTAKRK